MGKERKSRIKITDLSGGKALGKKDAKQVRGGAFTGRRPALSMLPVIVGTGLKGCDWCENSTEEMYWDPE